MNPDPPPPSGDPSPRPIDPANPDLPAYFAELKDHPDILRRLTSRGRLFNSIGGANVERIREVLALGASPNMCDKKGRPALVRAVKGYVVEAAIVQALLDYGANPFAADPEGHTALDHARRRLAKYEGRPRKPPRRSPSLTESGDVKLHDFENRMLDRMHHENPEFADDFERDYLEERRKAALRVFDTRGNLEKIVEILAARAHG